MAEEKSIHGYIYIYIFMFTHFTPTGRKGTKQKRDKGELRDKLFDRVADALISLSLRHIPLQVPMYHQCANKVIKKEINK